MEVDSALQTEPQASTSTALPPAAAPRRPRPVATTSAPPLPRTVVRQGDNVLIRMPSKIIKPIKVTASGNVSLGKYGSFKAKELIGRPYGDTFEILEDGGLEVVKATLNEIEDTEANNENILSSGAQKLTSEDIQLLRSEGKSGREIIQKQVEEHSAFELKTEYSKDKYMKRKEAKYLQMFTLVEPTVHEITQYHFEKQASKTRDMRPDTLSQIMTMANVRPGGKLLVVEDLHGLIVAAAVERMGGDGRILIINDFDSPPDFHLLEAFNFSPADLAPIAAIHWAATEEGYVPPDLPLEAPEDTPPPAAPSPKGEAGADAVAVQRKNTRELHKLRKRKATFDKTAEAREEYFAGGFDSIIIACEYEPYSILERLLPSIAGSAPIVVYSPHLQVLQDAHVRLRATPEFLAPTITEPWLRKYQVLPGRCHPEMNGLAHGGFLLSCIRVFNDEEANSVLAGRRKRRKLKKEAEAAKEATRPAPEEEEGDGGVGEEGVEVAEDEVEGEASEEATEV